MVRVPTNRYKPTFRFVGTQTEDIDPKQKGLSIEAFDLVWWRLLFRHGELYRVDTFHWDGIDTGAYIAEVDGLLVSADHALRDDLTECIADRVGCSFGIMSRHDECAVVRIRI